MPVKLPIFVALLIAVGGGMAISIQSTVVSMYGSFIGPVRTGFFIHLAGAITGGFLLAAMYFLHPGSSVAAEQGIQYSRLAVYFMVAGSMGMIVVPSIAVSFPRIGLVAGQVAIIIGQTIVALIIDTSGFISGESLPLDHRRIMGLVVMAFAAYLLLPKSPG